MEMSWARSQVLAHFVVLPRSAHCADRLTVVRTERETFSVTRASRPRFRGYSRWCKGETPSPRMRIPTLAANSSYAIMQSGVDQANARRRGYVQNPTQHRCPQGI